MNESGLAKDKEFVLRTVKDNNITFIRLWFTDILGVLKSFTITSDELEGAMEEGFGFDGSSVTGFHAIEESDTLAMPVPSTFSILPWDKGDLTECRMFCDILEPTGEPFAGDPRYILKQNIAEAKKMGFEVLVGPELEYFYFRTSYDTEILDKGGYFDLGALDQGELLRKETVLALNRMGIKVECSHHEVAPSQHEIDLRYAPALQMADWAQTYKKVVKKVAQDNGVSATFMPKPIYGENGSGMHTHQSLFTNGRNAFFDPDDQYHLSETGRYYLAGLLKHARAITAICNPTVNSYKRLVPGYEAPVYVAWSQRNRSALVRLPFYKPGKENAVRLEFRSPDPACNPYLAFSAMLAAGLDGIRRQYTLESPVIENIYTLVKGHERYIPGLTTLPGSLEEALNEMEKSDLLKRCLGEHIFTRFLELKRLEWHEFIMTVTPYEIEHYLSL